MDDIVAVHGIPSMEISEPNEEPYLIVWSEDHNILAGHLKRRRRLPVPREDLEFFEVNVDRVGPATPIVLQDPDLCGALLGAARTSFTLKNFPLMVHLIIIAKHPPPGSHHLTQVNVGEGAQRGRDLAVVGRIAIHVKPQDRRARVQQSS